MTPHTQSFESPRGFVAVISAVLISTILLGLAATAGSSTLFARFDALNSEYKRVSLGLAESCIHAALLRIGENYNYLVGSDPLYDAARGGAVISVSGGDCVIKSPTTTPTEVGGKRTFTIATQGQYKGAFSNLSVSAVAQSPTQAPVVPPPTCALAATPTSVPSGQSVTLTWSVSSNASSLSIDHGVGSVALSGPPWATVTPSGIGTVLYRATVSNAGGSNTCDVTVTVTAPPPAPSCADTVMILDRTGSMSGSDLNNEEAAADAVVALYQGVSPSDPKVGVGSFGGLDGSAASVPSNGVLTAVYSNITNAINSITNSNSSVGSNLGAAINVGAAELNSVRHIVDGTTGEYPKKVLIFVSDGLPTQPSSGTSQPTPWQSPSATASPNEWSNASSAYSANNVYATADDDNDDQGYRNFNFPTIPSNADIEGIEVRFEAYSAVSASATTLLSDNFGTSGTSNDIPNWDEEGSDSGSTSRAQAPGSGEDSASPSGGRFALIGGDDTGTDDWICRSMNASGVTALQLAYQWRGDAQGESDDDGIVEYNDTSSPDCTDGLGSWTQLALHPMNDTGWQSNSINLPATLENDGEWLIRFRANMSADDEAFRVDNVVVTGTSGPANSSCQLQVRIGENGDWSGYRTATLTGTEASYTLGDDDDDWGEGWDPGDFENDDFELEVRFNDPDGNCDASAVATLDHLEARVHYSVPVSPSQFALDAANAAKSSGGINDPDPLPVNIFSIHFGDSSGQSFMQQLASPSLIPVANITTATRSGGTVTVTTAAPHKFVENQRIVTSGIQGCSQLNRTATITAVTSNTFQFSISSSGCSAGTGGVASPTNLFIAPNSSDMEGIFRSIGMQMCPAAAAACANGIDDDSDGFTDEYDPGCHTDNDAGNPATYDDTDNDEWESPGTPVAPPSPPPPPSIEIGSWTEIP